MFEQHLKNIEGESKKKEKLSIAWILFSCSKLLTIQQTVIFSQTQGLFFPRGSSPFAFQTNCCHRGWHIYLFACSLDMQEWKHMVLGYHFSISDKMDHNHRGTHQKSLSFDDCASNLPQGQAHRTSVSQ